jgi:transcriptional regulator of met regulon
MLQLGLIQIENQSHVLCRSLSGSFINEQLPLDADLHNSNSNQIYNQQIFIDS